MSIFFDVSSILLVEMIKRERDRLEGSYTSNLATEKSDFAKKLRKDILNLENKEDDAATVKSLKELISKCRSGIAEKCEAENFDEGTFGQTMKKLISLVDELYKVFAEKRLINIRLNDALALKPKSINPTLRYNDPLEIFYYHAAFYISEKVLEPKNTITYNLSAMFWSPVKVSNEKIALLMQSLSDCRRALEELDKQKPLYPLARANRVVNFIEEVLRKNEETCINHATLENVPLAFNFPLSTLSITPTAKPSRGELKGCMEKAITEIRALIDTLAEMGVVSERAEQLQDAPAKSSKINAPSDSLFKGSKKTNTAAHGIESEATHKNC